MLRKPPPAAKWLAAAAAVAVVLTGIGAATNLRDRGSAGQSREGSATAADTGAATKPVRNETGNDYADRAALAAAVGGLLAGTAAPEAASLPAETRAAPGAALPAAPAPAAPAQPKSEADEPAAVGGEAPGQVNDAVADPLGRLRTETGLAECLRAVLPPEDPSLQPLALDYGSYRGTPALVIVLPGASRESLDVFVVGAKCSQADDGLLFYASVPAP